MMFCFSEQAKLRREQKRRNKNINAEIHQYKDEYLATHHLLMLGPINSGKRTLFNTFRILSRMDVLDYSEEQSIAVEVKLTIREIIMTVIKGMSDFNPPIALELPENEAHVKYILEEASKPDYDFPEEFYDHCMKLWEDKGVVECYGRSNEYQLHHCAPYFMNPEKLQAIADVNFIPNNDDFMHCWVMKMEGSRPFEWEVSVDRVKFHITLIGRLQGNYHKWMQYFNGVTAIWFVVACDSYNLYTQEDPTKNRLGEAVELFENIWNNRWLKNVSVIMFLNKQDLLKTKVLEGRFKIESYFPEYNAYQLSSDGAREPGEREEVRRAKGFIRDLFVKVTKASPDNQHSFYTHFTCAVDTESIRKVFNDCRDIIQRIHLRQYELL